MYTYNIYLYLESIDINITLWPTNVFMALKKKTQTVSGLLGPPVKKLICVFYTITFRGHDIP